MKKLSLLLALMLIAVIPFGATGEETAPLYTEDELEIATTAIEKLRNMMKDPESFRLYEDVLLTGDYDGVIHFIIDAGARNSFGGLNRTNYYIVFDKLNEEYDFFDMNDQDGARKAYPYMEVVQKGLEEYAAAQDPDAPIPMKVIPKEEVLGRLPELKF